MVGRGAKASSSAGTAMDLTYNFLDTSSHNNGNVMGITNNRDTTRTQSFSYDSLNRIITAKTSSTSGSNCWGETYTIDQWSNLTAIGAVSGYTGCTQQSLSIIVNGNNQVNEQGFSYDGAGEVLTDGTNTYTWNAEGKIKSVAGVNYTYDGDGRRVQKSNGKLYWYGLSSDPLAETDGSGNLTDEYVFFGGKRIARRDASNSIVFYSADHLGTSRVVTSSTGTILDDSDFYPFGGERVVLSSSGNTYKFTGKERDSESGLDNFGARYNSSSTGRFMSPDPLGGKLLDPQTLNKYSYVRNSPINLIDPTGLYICADNSKCSSKQDKAFEKARQNDLKSTDPNVVRGAQAYGDPTKDNGTTVKFGDPGNGKAGNTTSDLRQDPNDPNKYQAVETVTIKPGQSGADLDATVGHEGSHVADAQDFVASITPTGEADQSKNLTKYQTELKAYLVTQSILDSESEKRSFGNCGLAECVLGRGVLPAQALDTINQYLAKPAPAGYGVTPANPGPVLYPTLTTPK
jgi:RHS repeat-associated protein